jgi:integrase
MSTLYQPTVVSYTLPDGKYRTPEGKRVTSSTPGAVRVETKSPTWWGRYTDANGQEHQVKLSRKKEIARRMLAKLAGDAQLASVGIADPFAEHRARPLGEHVGDFAAYLRAKGNTEQHVRLTEARCRAILTGCDAEALEDLQPSAVLETLARLRANAPARVELPADQKEFTKGEVVAVLGINEGSLWRMLRRAGWEGTGLGRARRFPRGAVEALQERYCRGTGVTSCNHYLTAIKGFTRWLVRDRRAPLDPLTCLSRLNGETDVRVERRTLDTAELAAFVRAARAGQPFRGLSGDDRAVLYQLAARTGLRASELASLSPASFDFAARIVTVEAAYSKRRRRDEVDLRADVARLVQDYVEGLASAELLWPGTWPEVGAEMVRLDLAAAGISYFDDRGRVYDFHALRHQFISDLVEADVHPKDAQKLARHSTITLTMDRYAHVRQVKLRAALDKLPPLPEAAPPPAQPARKEA